MSRTPLMRALRKLFRDCRLARKQQLPLHGLAERRLERSPTAEQKLSRRSALAMTAAGAAWLAAPEVARAEHRVRAGRGASVAVVGGGIAGLSCALQLQDHGCRATVYEASGRAGGRIFSNGHYFTQGQVSEWGGELIDSSHLTLQRLARRFGLVLDDVHAGQPRGSEETYHLFGEYYRQAQADADFLGGVYEALEGDLDAAGYPTSYDSYTEAGRVLDAMSVFDWIESRVPGGHATALGALLDLAYTIEYGADTHDQSALNLLYLLGFQPTEDTLSVFGESDERYHVRGGNQQIPNAIAESLPDIRYGHALTRVRRTPAGRYELSFERGARTVEALVDYVVLAIPFAVLREVDLSHAGFDSLKLRAVRELGAGRNAKTQLQFHKRFWHQAGPWPGRSNGSSYADTGYQASWEVSRAQPGFRGILVFYAGGSRAESFRSRVPFGSMRSQDVSLDVAETLARAEPVFPGAQRSFTGLATQSLPHHSHLFRASYSYYRVGQYLAFGGYEAVGQGGVLFCGEHTSRDFQGFMEGGASEGERAAAELLSTLRG